MLKDNLKKVQTNIKSACERVGRKPEEVTLVAVSKMKPLSDIEELLETGQMEPDWLVQGQEMCARLYPAGLNIDYYPTNFVPCDGTLYYIDYECNVYMEEWDFEHWGIQYWTMQASEGADKT